MVCTFITFFYKFSTKSTLHCPTSTNLLTRHTHKVQCIAQHMVMVMAKILLSRCVYSWMYCYCCPTAHVAAIRWWQLVLTVLVHLFSPCHCFLMKLLTVLIYVSGGFFGREKALCSDKCFFHFALFSWLLLSQQFGWHSDVSPCNST